MALGEEKIYKILTSIYGRFTVNFCTVPLRTSTYRKFAVSNRFKCFLQCIHSFNFSYCIVLFPGDFGRYQALQFFLHVLSAVTAGIHMLSLVTVAAVPDHRCFIESIDTNVSYAPWNSSEILAAIPQKNGGLDSCAMFGGNNDTIVPCTAYVYDDTYYKSSRTIEWNFVCDKRWMGAIAQTIFMFGVFTGAIVLGGLADKVGRKKIFCWSAILQLFLGVGVAFIPSYIPFLIVRYLYGIFGSAGSYITGFVLTMELVGPSKRFVSIFASQRRVFDLIETLIILVFAEHRVGLPFKPHSLAELCWLPVGEH